MSFITRFFSSFFASLPAVVFFVLVMGRQSMRQEYYWTSILCGVVILLGSAMLLGFVLPPLLRPKWLWIWLAGFAAMLFALAVIAVLNATPLCVGQDNGDGNDDFGMCMGYVFLYAIVYGIPYLVLLTFSTLMGHWVLTFRRPSMTIK